MKSFKKLLAILLAMFVLTTCCLLTACKKEEEESLSPEDKKHDAFIEEIGGVSETYKGEASKTTFATSNDAASAFVKEQVANKTTSIVNTTSKGNLSNSEIANLKLSEADSEGLVSVEKVEVEYSSPITSAQVSGQRIKTAGQLTNNKKVVVYIIKYENYFKYFTPCPVTGETINKGYYDSVFASERYTNCTYEYKMTLNMAMSASGQGQSMDMDMKMDITQKALYSENALYLEMTEELTGMSSVGVPDTKVTYYLYIEKVTTEDSVDFICYYSEDNLEWSEAVELISIGYSDISDLAPFAEQYLDFTYFTKTDFGFEVSGENADRYVSEVFESLGTYSELGNMDINMIAKYYVSQGALFGMRLEMDMSMAYSVQGVSASLTADALGEAKISNCGTTVVEKPFTE